MCGPLKAPECTDLTFPLPLTQGSSALLVQVQNTLPQAASCCLSGIERLHISKGIETAVVTAKGDISQEL